MAYESLRIGILIWAGLFILAIYAGVSGNQLSLGMVHYVVMVIVVVSALVITTTVVQRFISIHYNSSVGYKRKGDGEDESVG